MSKHSDKKTKVVENYTKPYYQTYVPTPYVAATYDQNVVLLPSVQPTQIITSEPTVIRERRVIQGEPQYSKTDHLIHEGCSCAPCMPCAPCCDNEQKIVTRQVVLKEKQPIPQPNTDEFEKKLNEIEKLHVQEVKEIEFKMQQQLDYLQNQKIQEESQRQIGDLKQSLSDLRSQLANSRAQPVQQPVQQGIAPYYVEKLEKQLSKKKKKIKDLKQTIAGFQQEVQFKNSQIQELDFRLRQPQPVVHVPVPQENVELVNQVRYLEQERGSLIREIDQLRATNSDLASMSFRQDPEKIRLHQDYSRMINDFRTIEQENIKLATIIGQKDDLIKSLEQRISVELSRQSILLQQQSPQRVVLEQTTTTRPLQTQYVIDSSQYTYQQPVHKQYIIQDQPVQTVQPTLLQQTLPNIKIVQ